MKYKIMMGVLPGYGHENDELTPETSLEIGKEAVLRRMPIELQKNCNVNGASAIYSKNFGCPTGGELGVQLAGEINGRSEIRRLIESVKGMMRDLGQNTVTIEWEEEGKSMGSTYLYDGGEGVKGNFDPKEVESFSVKIPAEDIEFVALGKKLQDALEKVNGFTPKKLGTPLYMVSGVLTECIDENGRNYYEYSGTQNPDYGQVDRDTYQFSTLLTVALATEGLGNVVVEFNGESVIVQDKELEKEKGIQFRNDKSKYEIEKYLLMNYERNKLDKIKDVDQERQIEIPQYYDR